MRCEESNPVGKPGDERIVKVQLRWLIGLAMVLVLFAVVALFRLLGQTAFVQHTYVYMDRLRALTVSVDNSESAIRSYLFTEIPAYRDEYRKTAAHISSDAKALADNTLTPEGKQWF